MNNGAGLYVHIPFCARKCPYCDFYSVKFDEALADRYTISVCSMMRFAPSGLDVNTIYFGGGTPSLFGAGRILKILSAARECVNVCSDSEITIEANPASCTAQDLAALYEGGVNRISFGVQSLNDAELKALRRLHTAEDARRGILEAHEAGFRRISADLMLGVPGQTQETLRASIDGLAELPLDHISAYILAISNVNDYPSPDEDNSAKLYLYAVGRLKLHRFIQYEISNFAKAGSVSRHNLKYWRCGPYLGIGPAAHSFLEGKRFHLPDDLDAFISADNPFALRISEGNGGSLEEYAMLRLRLCEGLDLAAVKARYVTADVDSILSRARGLESQGVLQIGGDTIRLTPRGFLLSNAIIAELLA